MKISPCFSKPHESYCEKIKVELDLSSYATKSDLKRATGVDTSNLAGKSDLVSLRVEVDKTEIDKLKIAPADLSKLSNIVDNDVVKKTVYEKLVTKAKDNSGFVLKT